mgnify:CR=1 FL=1
MLTSALLSFLIGAVGPASPARAQSNLAQVNDETTVVDITWNFPGTQSFNSERLEAQIATKAPGTFYTLKRWFDWVPRVDPGRFPFDAITLQKDVARIRQFYRQNGFLKPYVDYPATQYNSESNTVDIEFLVREGPPLIVRNTEFVAKETGKPARTLFSANAVQKEWQSFRSQTAFQRGERYTEFTRLQIEESVTTWLRDQGFAFASVESETQIDSTANEASIRYLLTPGPNAVFSEIRVEGTASVNPNVVRRELPFREGDRFNASKVTQGQRELFGLNLFRVALADIPQQDPDTTVQVRYRVREAKLRTLSGQIGYGGRPGVFGEGRWTHRNFYGGARNLSVGLIAESGYPTNDPLNFFGTTANADPQRRFRLSTALRQPYVFTTRLSGSVEPFFQERLNDKLVPASDRLLSLNERQFGLNTRLTYEILPFRTINFQYTFTRTQQFSPPDESTDGGALLTAGETDLFDKSIISVDATLGRTDDFINPTRGFLIRPSAELGGAILGSDVEFAKLGLEVTGYLPLDDQVEIAARLFAGRIWPLGRSLEALTLPDSSQVAATDNGSGNNQNLALADNFIFQNRFSDFLFYAGGSSDVRGWPVDLAGGKTVRFSTITSGYIYEATGAQSKIGANVELRLPFPWLGDAFRTAVFLDAARLNAGSLNLTPPSQATDVVTAPNGSVVATETSQFLVGTGVGMRYKTPAGFIRLDVAYKLTPDQLDLRQPDRVGDLSDIRGEAEMGEMKQPPFTAEERFIRRFRLHFGIGRTF